MIAHSIKTVVIYLVNVFLVKLVNIIHIFKYITNQDSKSSGNFSLCKLHLFNGNIDLKKWNMKKDSRHLMFWCFLISALIIILFHFLFHPIRVLGMSTSIFYLDEQITLAAFFTIVVSFTTGYIALTHHQKVKNLAERLIISCWGVFFIIMAMDEYFEIHEYINTLVKLNFKNSQIGILANISWIFPLLTLILTVFAFWTYILIKEKQTKVKYPLMVGLVSFMLVLVFELLGSKAFGKNIYILYVGLEEGLEMVGSSFFYLATVNKYVSTWSLFNHF